MSDNKNNDNEKGLSKPADVTPENMSERYQDPDDKDFAQVSSLSMKLSFWYYWHTFISLSFISGYAFYFSSLVPSSGLRIYDILGKPGVSKTTSKMWLNFLKIRISDELLLYPLYGIIFVSVLIMLYYILKVKTTEYNINFRFLEIKEGVFNQSVNQIDLFMIKDEELKRPLLYRILGISRMIIYSSDKTHPQLTIPGVDAKMADKFLHFIRTNAYGSSTEYWVAKDRRRRNEKQGPKNGIPVDRATVLGDGDVDE